MSREIKFRAWIDGEMIDPDSLAFEKYEPLADLLASCDNLMQYTGYNYQDSGGEMYTGDIVEVPGLGVAEVNIDTFYGVVLVQGKYETPLIDCLSERDHPVKIGNIHESPELLECK